MFTHNFDPILIDLYIIEVRWYSLAYIFGILVGWIYAKKIIKHLKTNSSLNYLNIKDFDEFVPYLVIGIILGGRLGYVLIYNFDYYIFCLRKSKYVRSRREHSDCARGRLLGAGFRSPWLPILARRNLK